MFVASSIISDRTASIQSTRERTQSLARMIVAHGDAAVDEAEKIIRSVEADVRAWNLSDPVVGRHIQQQLRSLSIGSGQISAAWVLDGNGVSLLDTWSVPPQPFSAYSFGYFQKHKQGFPGLLISGNSGADAPKAGERFTISRAQFKPDGSLRTIIVVGVYAGAFNTLYREVATWPGARAGFYTLGGEILARLKTAPRASPQFVARLEENVRMAPFGSAEIDEQGGPRLVSWQRSTQHPDLYATSSQIISAALADWRRRSTASAAIGFLSVALFGLFAWTSLRAGEARQAARINEMAVREVHHRVKNALQLIVSMIGLRMHQVTDPLARSEMEEISAKIRAVADVQDLLQSASTLDVVDPGALIGRLCAQLQKGYDGTIRYHGENGHAVNAATATSLAIIANELVTNAMKHGHGVIDVSCDIARQKIELAVSDNGPGLPADFSVDSNDRFGLRIAKTMADSIGGTLTASNDAAGATFRLELPEIRAAA
jgi:two-component sensor histidine kinase